MEFKKKNKIQIKLNPLSLSIQGNTSLFIELAIQIEEFISIYKKKSKFFNVCWGVHISPIRSTKTNIHSLEY